MKTKIRALAAAVLLLPAAAPVSARQQPTAPADSVVRLPALQARALLEDVARTPGAAAVVSDLMISRLRPYTLHDLLDHVAGVRSIDDDVLGRRGGIGVRGAPARRSRKTLLLEDGSPINSSTYLDPSAHYTPPLDRLERVEILKGAGQIVHGPLNNHGIINFRNRRAGPVPETTVELATGGMRTFKRHALHSRMIGSAGVVLAYTGMNADGAFDVERHQFDDFHGSLALQPGGSHRIESSVTYHRERSDGYDEANLTPAQFALDPRGKRGLGEGREHNNFSVDYLKADVVHAATTGLGVVSTRLFATELDRPRFQTRGTAPADGGVMEGRDRLYRTAGIETRIEAGAVRLLGVEQAVQVGIRHERHSFAYGRPVGRPGEQLDDRNRGDTYAAAGIDGYTRDGRLVNYAARAYSAFLQSALRTGRVVITPGVRIETYEQSRHIAYWPGHEAEGRRETDRNTLVLPGLSLLLPFPAAELYAGVHRGFAPAIARSEEFPLVPEIGVNSQLGLRAAMTPALSFDVALFYNHVRNTIIRDDVDSFGEALFVNTANSNVHGVDVMLRAGGIDGPFTELAYNSTRARFTGGPLHGNSVPEVPEHAGSLTAGWQYRDSWRLSATASHFGAFFSDEENTRELHVDAGRVPARTLVSARASWSPAALAGATIWVQGRNLLDRLYISDVQDGLRPGAPRTLMAGLTLGL